MCLSGAQKRETPIRMSPSFYLQAAIGGLLFWLIISSIPHPKGWHRIRLPSRFHCVLFP